MHLIETLLKYPIPTLQKTQGVSLDLRYALKNNIVERHIPKDSVLHIASVLQRSYQQIVPFTLRLI
jgi:hypothetical protein